MVPGIKLWLLNLAASASLAEPSHLSMHHFFKKKNNFHCCTAFHIAFEEMYSALVATYFGQSEVKHIQHIQQHVPDYLLMCAFFEG